MSVTKTLALSHSHPQPREPDMSSSATPAVKLALCVRTAEVKDDFSNVPELETMLVDRAICETDKSYLQIIPYVTLVSKVDGHLMQYSRGKAGGEGRLFSKTSIGLGGHMDNEVIGSFYSAVATETARELVEEVGIKDAQGIHSRILDQLYAHHFTFFHLKDSPNEVDHVHLALSLVLGVDPSECTALEEGVIVDPQWRELDELYEEVVTGVSTLELWSQVVVRNVVRDLKPALA